MMNKYYVYIHVKDGKVIYCGKGRKSRCVDGRIYDRAFEQGRRKYNVKEVEVFKVKYFDNEQNAFKYEEFLTSWYKKCGQCEFNIDIGNKLGEEHREKIGKSVKGEKNGMYGRTGEQAPCYGRTGEKHPMYGRTGEKHPRYGKHQTEEVKRRLSEINKGANSPTSKSVVAYTNSGSYYKEFACIKDAGRELGVDSSCITKCCKGKRKSVGKYKGEKLKWKYKE